MADNIQNTADEDLDGQDDADDDPMMSAEGYTAMTPEFDEEDMLDALEEPDEDEPQAELPPQEAYEAMKYQAPMSAEEAEILNETPFLGPNMTWVDDSQHNEFLEQRMSERYKGMDEALEDEMYGDDPDVALFDRLRAAGKISPGWPNGKTSNREKKAFITFLRRTKQRKLTMSTESGKYYKDINDPLADINGNMTEEEGIEAAGTDATLGRGRRGGGRRWGGAPRAVPKAEFDALVTRCAKRRARRLGRAVRTEDLDFCRAKLAKRGITQSAGAFVGDERDQFDFMVGDATLRAIGTDETLGEWATEILGRDVSGSGAWLYKLNPGYWLKSSRERSLIDKTYKAGTEQKAAEKSNVQKSKELASAERAAQAAEGARLAKAESEAMESRLKDIESNLSGEEPDAKTVVHEARVRNAKHHRAATELAKRAEQRDLTNKEIDLVKNLLKAHTATLNQAKGFTSGSFVGYRDTKGVQAAFLGEATPLPKDQWVKLISVATVQPSRLASYQAKHGIVLSSTQKLHLARMAKMTRLKLAKKLGATSTSGADLGFSLSSLAKTLGKGAVAAAVAPLAAVSYVAYKGSKYALNKATGSSSSPASPQQQAAAYAQQAAAARQKAYEAQQAAAAKADAEAAQQELQAAQQQAAMPPPPPDADPYASQEAYGDYPQDSFQGSYSAGDFEGVADSIGNNEKAKKIAIAAASNTPLGLKIRAGAALYKRAKKGEPKARLAIAKMQKKAKAGDPQAQRDLNAVKAGRVAVAAKGVHSKKIASKVKREERNRKGIAARKNIENKMGDRLARMTRARQLAKVAKVERKAAGGDKKAKARISVAVAKAKGGDKKAQTAVAALKLTRNLRLAARNPREKKNLKTAHKTLVAARRGKPAAIKKVRIAQAAARAGQPNAKRAVQRLQLAAALENTLKTGKVTHVASSAQKRAAAEKKLATQKKRVASGVATREEAIAAAKTAHALGKKDDAAKLTMHARSLRSATTPLKNAATVAAAAQQGNQEASGKIDDVLERAKAGDPAGINAAGNLAAVKALSDVQKGGSMSPQMAEATGIVQRAHAGDPEAKRIVNRVGEQARTGDSKAVEAAVALTAASAVIAATAAKPTARKQWEDKASESRGQKLDTEEAQKASEELSDIMAKVQSGDATWAEADRGRQLAMALNRPKVAAEISALMPPPDEATLTTLPDSPLPSIHGIGDAVKESLRALLFATPNPLANYREGVRSRGSSRMLGEDE